MWVFFENGTFYSAVVDYQDKDVFWVRARDRRSADLFADFADAEVLEWDGRDYSYRVKTTRETWGDYVAEHVAEARATNFKSEVGKNLGYKEGRLWLDALHDVWSVMFGVQNTLNRGGKKPTKYADDSAWLSYETWATRLDK